MDSDASSQPDSTSLSPAHASELNNLLHIIGGTTDLLGNIWSGSEDADKYLEMLRDSVERATAVTTQLIGEAAELSSKIVIHPAARECLARRARNAPQPASKSRVLVVDDEAMVLEVAECILSDAGFEVMTAQSGFECLHIFNAEPDAFSVVVLDLNMPVMDGEETFDRLRAEKPELPVLLNTGYINAARAAAMQARGLAAVVPKPCSSRDYVLAIRGVIAQHESKPADGILAAT